jgi:hypothetical protein
LVGVVYVACVVAVSPRILSWRASASVRTDVMLDAWSKGSTAGVTTTRDVVHHRDRKNVLAHCSWRPDRTAMDRSSWGPEVASVACSLTQMPLMWTVVAVEFATLAWGGGSIRRVPKRLGHIRLGRETLVARRRDNGSGPCAFRTAV